MASPSRSTAATPTGTSSRSCGPSPATPGASTRTRRRWGRDRKSTRLNSSHQIISYAVFCLKKYKFITAGAKIGSNYLKHYSKKLINRELTKDQLHLDNAADIYNSLSELKGGALKVAQMLSMDKNLLPTAYQQKFAMAQYSAPPLSYPLVVKTFQKHFGKGPDRVFDSFSTKAANAASMGQVHSAVLNGKKLAVKIQYPGVGDSVKSDLAMVKPIALTMFKLNPVEYDEFIS